MAQRHAAVRAKLGTHGVHLIAQLAARKDEVELHQNVIVPENVAFKARRLRGERKEDAVDLLFLPDLQLLELIVRLHDAHRLNKKRCAGRGDVVHETGQLPAAFRLDGHDKAPVALRDDRLLQNALIARRRNDALEDLTALGCRRALVAADLGKLGARRVGDLIFVRDGGGDLLLQKAVGVERGEHLIEDRRLRILMIVFAHAAHVRQKSRDVQKLARVEHTAARRSAQRLRHALHAAKARTSAQGDHAARRVRFIKQAVHLVAVRRRHELSRALLRRVAHRVALKLRKQLRQLEHADGFFKQFTHGSFSPSN